MPLQEKANEQSGISMYVNEIPSDYIRLDKVTYYCKRSQKITKDHIRLQKIT